MAKLAHTVGLETRRLVSGVWRKAHVERTRCNASSILARENVMKCEWCGAEFHESERMMALIVVATNAFVCYECALEWVSEPRITLDFDVES